MRKFFIYFCISFLTSFTPLISQSLNGPAAVKYDSAHHRYLISNYNKGTILALDNKGKYTNFISSGLQSPRGIEIVNNTLYVADGAYIRPYNLENGASLNEIVIQGAASLIGLTSDTSGNLYASDYHSTDPQNNSVYKINIENENYIKVTFDSTIEAPRGLKFDIKKNYLIITDFSKNSSVYTYDISAKRIVSVNHTNIQNFDGITWDNKGNYYISSWGDLKSGSGKVYMFKNNFQTNKVLVSGKNSPGDLYYNTDNDTLIIPYIELNKIDFINMKVPQVPVLLSPNNKEMDVPRYPVFRWTKLNDQVDYYIHISKDTSFSDKIELIVNYSKGDSVSPLNPLDTSCVYYWRMKAVRGPIESEWSPVWSFTTVTPSGVEDDIISNSFETYPNPSSTEINIKTTLPMVNNVEITVYDIYGNEIIPLEYYLSTDNLIVLKIQHLITGSYFIKIKYGNKIEYQGIKVIR